MLNNPFIHTFKTYGGHYLYDVNKNAIIEILPDTYELLNGMTKKKTKEHYHKNYEENYEIKLLKRNNFLSTKRIKEIVHPADETLFERLDRKLNMITLQITQQCNLRCGYCAYSGDYFNRGHSNKRMSLDLAKKGIDFLIDHSKDGRGLSVGFYGGEPLLEFKLIKECISYAEENAEGKGLIFSITTNGTLLKEEVIEYFQKHNINLVISLDGPKNVHDRNRKFASNGGGSFDKIIENLEMIRTKYADFYKKISINTVLTSRNDFRCIDNFYTKLNTVKDVNLFVSSVTESYRKESTNKSINDNFSIQYEHEKFKFLLWKLGRFKEKNISPIIKQETIAFKRLYDLLIPSEEVPDKAHHGGPCIPGVQRLFMNADGLFYPCERVSEKSETMVIGNIESGFDINKIRALLNIGKLTEENCKNCWAFRFCYLCASSADNLTNLSGEIKSSHCSRVRRETEELFKLYCTMKKFGYNYQEEKVFKRV